MLEIEGSNLKGSPFWMGMSVAARREWLELFIDVVASMKYHAAYCRGKCFLLFFALILLTLFFILVDCVLDYKFQILLTEDGAPPQVCLLFLSFSLERVSPFSLFLSISSHLPPPFLFAPLSPFSLSPPFFLSFFLSLSLSNILSFLFRSPI